MYEPTEKQKELLEQKLKLIWKEYYLPKFQTSREFQEYLNKLDNKIQKQYEKTNQPTSRNKDKLYHYCLNLLNRFGLYTENKLIEKMQTKTSNKENIDSVIKKLKEENLINDEKFAEVFIYQQLNKWKWYYHIIKKLQEKWYTWDQEPTENDEFESLTNTLDKLLQGNEFSDLSSQKQRQKLLAKLQRKWYRFNLILSAVKEFEEQEKIPKLQYQEEETTKEKNIQKDANKVIQKFRFNDLSEYKQKSKFIQKMMYRWYTYEEINNYLNNQD